jgi:hypothetical protein
MGSLIQTKGTQRLARLFNNRFDKGSIGQTRQVKNSSGTLLQTASLLSPLCSIFRIPSSRNIRAPIGF